jgi:hypothetical protein
MYDTDTAAEHDAVTRLYELARNGDTDNCEFSQLDSMVYARLQQAYAVDESSVPAQSRTAD